MLAQNARCLLLPQVVGFFENDFPLLELLLDLGVCLENTLKYQVLIVWTFFFWLLFVYFNFLLSFVVCSF